MIHTCPKCGADFVGEVCTACAVASPPPAPTLRPGASVRGLEILDLLGRGGMGAVYRARQPALDRVVALKILPPEKADLPGFAERFQREAKALAALSHPNIVAIHDSGQEGEILYLVMEFVEGQDLRRFLSGRRPTPEEVSRILKQVCDALEFAHRKGIVHRDIKPENILIDRDGKVKIADFGLAKLTDAAPGLSQTSMAVGTAKYMAPEQMTDSSRVDHRADLYSVGVVLYEMLTGEAPIGLADPPSKTAGVDPRFDAAVLKALARRPEERPQSAAQLGEMISAAAVGTPPAVARRRPLLWIAALLGIAVLASVTAFALRKKKPEPRPTVLVPELKIERVSFAPSEYPHQRRLVRQLVHPERRRDGDEISAWVKKFVNDSELDVGGMRTGTLHIWEGCGVLAVAGPFAERLEGKLRAVDRYQSWLRRRGESLVYAWAASQAERFLLDDLVVTLRSKLELTE